MDPNLRRFLSLSPIALSTALAFLGAQGASLTPWLSSSAQANHCTPPPPPCVECDCNSCCDSCYGGCDCAGCCDYTEDRPPRVP